MLSAQQSVTDQEGQGYRTGNPAEILRQIFVEVGLVELRVHLGTNSGQGCPMHMMTPRTLPIDTIEIQMRV